MKNITLRRKIESNRRKNNRFRMKYTVEHTPDLENYGGTYVTEKYVLFFP